MISPSVSSDLQDTGWQRASRSGLIAVQAACLVIGPWAAAQAIVPEVNLSALPWLALLAAGMGCLSAQWATQPRQRWVEKGLFQLAEWVTLMLAVRLALWAIHGSWPSWQEMRGWLLAPQGFFDAALIICALLVSLAWQRAWVVGTLFQQFALSAGELAYAHQQRTAGWWRWAVPAERSQINRLDLLEQYIVQWMAGGVLIALFAAATRLNIDRQLNLTVFQSDMVPTVVAAAILYFVIGLLLAAQARLALLRARWSQEGVEMAPHLAQRWNRTALAWIGGLALLAALLPLGSTWRLSAIANTVAVFAMRLALLVAFLIASAFALLLNLFGYQKPLPEMTEEFMQLEPEVIASAEVSQVPPWIGGVSLWLVVGIVVAVALWLLFVRYGGVLSLRRLRDWLAQLWTEGRGWSLAALTRMQTALQISRARRRRGVSSDAMPWRTLRLKDLSTRQQIRYFYLSMIHHADRRGARRIPNQTPTEFSATLEAHWPQAEADVTALTEAFVRARYDVTAFSGDEAAEVKSSWQRMKRYIRMRSTRGNP